jgi:hypothetical protein
VQNYRMTAASLDAPAPNKALHVDAGPRMIR